MRKLFVVLTCLSFFTVGLPLIASATNLAWYAPTTNANGTPLTDLGGYNVYRCDMTTIPCDKSTATIYAIAGPNSLNVDISSITVDTQWFVTAFDDKTPVNESGESNCVVGSATHHGMDPCPTAPSDTMAPSAPTSVRIP